MNFVIKVRLTLQMLHHCLFYDGSILRSVYCLGLVFAEKNFIIPRHSTNVFVWKTVVTPTDLSAHEFSEKFMPTALSSLSCPCSQNSAYTVRKLQCIIKWGILPQWSWSNHLSTRRCSDLQKRERVICVIPTIWY